MRSTLARPHPKPDQQCPDPVDVETQSLSTPWGSISGHASWEPLRCCGYVYDVEMGGSKGGAECGSVTIIRYLEEDVFPRWRYPEAL